MDQLTIDMMRQLNKLQSDFDGQAKPEFAIGFSLISETILTGSVASVTFSSFPQTFRNLFYYIQVRTDRATEVGSTLLHFNADTAANYDRQYLRANDVNISGNGIRATAASAIGITEAANARANNFTPISGLILGYSETDREKQALNYSVSWGDVSADTDIFMDLTAIRWRNTAAITSIVFSPNIGPNFVSGSTFQLYGMQ